MKSKRFVSILMTVIMMLSALFCAIPTASASTKLPKVEFVSNIQLQFKPKTNYKIKQFSELNPRYYLIVGNKSLTFMNHLLLFKNNSFKVTSSNKQVAYVYDDYNIATGKGNNSKAKITSSGKITKDNYKEILSLAKKEYNCNKNELLAIKNYLIKNNGKKISYSYNITSETLKLKVTDVDWENSKAWVTLNTIGPSELYTSMFYLSNGVAFTHFSQSKIRFRVEYPKCKDTLTIYVNYKPSGKNTKSKIIGSIKAKPYLLTHKGYTIQGV